MITQAIALTLLACLAFYAGGYLRGIFESILIFDTAKTHLGPYWSFELFGSAKDRNKDGKLSLLETHFPDDGGHKAKRWELMIYALGAGILALANDYLSAALGQPWYILAAVPVLWWCSSFGFLRAFKKYRYVKKV